MKKPKPQPQGWEMNFDRVFVKMLQCLYGGDEQENEAKKIVKSFFSQEREKAERIGFDRAMQSVPNPNYSEAEVQRRCAKAKEEVIQECKQIVEKIKEGYEIDIKKGYASRLEVGNHIIGLENALLAITGLLKK